MERIQNEAEEIILQLEQGEQTNRLHWQGYIKTHKKIRSRALINLLRQDFIGVEISGVIDIERYKEYVTKDNTRIQGPFFYPEIEDETQWDEEDVMLVEQQPYPWQSLNKIMQIVDQPPNKRHIIVIFDPIRGNGKNFMQQWLFAKRYGQPIGSASSGINIKYARALNKASKVVWVNIPRSIPSNYDTKELYGVLEEIKDGLFFSDKYKSGAIKTKKPHVIIFTNRLPNPTGLSIEQTDGKYI